VSEGRKRVLILAILFAGYICRGLPESVLGVIWPAMRLDFGVPFESAGTLSMITKIGGIVSSSAAGYFGAKWNVGLTLAAGGLLAVATMLGYALAQGWLAVLLMTFPVGLGVGACVAISSSYAAKRYSTRVIGLLNCSWGVSVTSATFLMTSILHHGYSWRLGYIAIACVQGMFVLSFLLTSGVWRAGGEENSPPQDVGIFVGRRKFIMAFASYFTFGLSYAVLEVTVPLWGATMLHDLMGSSLREAGMSVTVFWIAFTIGRLLIGVVRTGIRDIVLIRCGIATAAVGAAILSVSANAAVATVASAIAGLGAGPIFPLVTHDTPRRIGDAAVGRIIGVFVAANYTGAAILPALTGYIATKLSIRVMGPVMVLFAIAALIANEVSESSSLKKY
jgi:MFS family permease